MSVLVSDRKESKFEAVTYSIELHAMLTELMQRGFGIGDPDNLVRMRYAHGKDDKEDFSKYRYLMHNSKNRIDQTASLLTSNVRAANTLYPTSMHEYEQRRDYQNNAIANCEQLIKELQRVVEIFEVDINIYNKHVKAIDREIGLIKKWRQRDNKIKSYLQGNI
jgi:Ser-tRNA(Ala) deacylase AlaX